MSLVLDASVALAWVHENEITPAVFEILEHIRGRGAWAPGLWRLEVANVLEMGVRRGHFDAAFVDATLSDLDILPIKLDPKTNERAWVATVQLARRHRLTVYDAAYLELALRLALPLATLDKELRSAAALEKVELLGV